MMSLIETLILGSYIFSAALAAAGAKAFLYLYKLVTNHLTHRLERIENHLGMDHGDE